MTQKEKSVLDFELLISNPELLANTISETQYLVFQALLGSKHALTVRGIQREIAIKKVFDSRNAWSETIEKAVPSRLAHQIDKENEKFEETKLLANLKQMPIKKLVVFARKKKIEIPTDSTIKNALDELVAESLVERTLLAEDERANAIYFVNLNFRKAGFKL